jgi:hypothetical protein
VKIRARACDIANVSVVTGDHYQWEAASGIKLTNNESSGGYPANRTRPLGPAELAATSRPTKYSLCTRSISSFFTHNCGPQLHLEASGVPNVARFRGTGGIASNLSVQALRDQLHRHEFSDSRVVKVLYKQRYLGPIRGGLWRSGTKAIHVSPWSTFGWKGSI